MGFDRKLSEVSRQHAANEGSSTLDSAALTTPGYMSSDRSTLLDELFDQAAVEDADLLDRLAR